MSDNTPQFNTDAQRRALDVMSAKLLDNLNTMIAEQEARVQEFSRQQTEAAKLSATPEQWYQTSTPAPKPQPKLTITYTNGGKTEEVPPPLPQARTRSVTPPPAAAQKKKAPEQPFRIPRPSLNRPVPTAKGEEKDGSIGCGSIAVIVTIIIILLRACS